MLTLNSSVGEVQKIEGESHPKYEPQRHCRPEDGTLESSDLERVVGRLCLRVSLQYSSLRVGYGSGKVCAVSFPINCNTTDLAHRPQTPPQSRSPFDEEPTSRVFCSKSLQCNVAVSDSGSRVANTVVEHSSRMLASIPFCIPLIYKIHLVSPTSESRVVSAQG